MTLDYVRVSALMFLEFAIWGAWMPVLALRLLGPMKLNGRQTGWIYATFPLACIFSPLVSGYLADKSIDARWLILACHAIGALLLLIAAKQTKFGGMFAAMLAYSVFYTATLPLVNKVLFQNIPQQATWVFFWAPVAWAIAGYSLTGWRQLRRAGGDGPDSLYFAAALSVLMALVCLVQPETKPQLAAATAGAANANPMAEALAMLGNTNYSIFLLIQLVVCGMQQFYFLGTGRFLQDRGASGKNVSAIMALAQAVQAAATILLLDRLLRYPGLHGYGELTGYQWAFIVGSASWAVLFAVYILTKQTAVLALFQAFHGLAYVFFVIAGQMFVGVVAPKEIGASAQSLLFIATSGIGLFLGTQMAGMVMQKNTVEGKFQWSKIWAVPLVITLVGAIVFAVAFKVPGPKDFIKKVESKPVAAALER